MATETPTAATPIAFVHAILLAYQRYGCNPAAALKKAQIAPELLKKPTARITAWQMQQISGSAMQELDDEALGWFSRRLPWGSYGMLVRASISAPTLQLALSRWCRHHGLIAPDITVSLATAADTATIRITEHCDLGELREFCLVSVLRNVLGVASWLVDSRIALRCVELPFEAPAHHSAYSVLFPAPTQFDCARAAIIFDARYLALPVRRDEAALQHMLQNALPLTVLQYRRDRLLVQQVRQALLQNPGDTHSAEGLAHLLNVSARTLHRQLREEGASLQTLKDGVRRERAMDLLLRTHKPLKQVAQACGFQNDKSFIRAFKTWSGLTPAEFRRRNDVSASL